METTVQRVRYVLEVLEPAVAGKKVTLPILQNVVVGQGKAYATNLDTSVTVEFPEATDDPVLLPHRQLLSLLKHVPGPTRLSLNRDGAAIRLLAGATSAELTVPGEVNDFPPLVKLQPIGEGQVDADLFLKTAATIAEYAAIEDSRPSLKCVCITLGAPLQMAGADGFRLAWQTLPMALPALNSPPIAFSQLLLPTEAVRTLAKLWKVMDKQPTGDTPLNGAGADPLKDDGGFRLAMLSVAKRMATIKFTQRALTFEHGDVSVRVQLTEGEFPNYLQLIPTDLPHKVSFDAEEALRALRSLHDIASEGRETLRLNWGGDSLVFSARSEEDGAITTRVRAHVKGGEGRIAFKVGYLAQYLAGKMGTVLFETSAPSNSARFYHSGSPDVLLMPMFVQWGDEAVDQPVDQAGEEEPVGDDQDPVDAKPEEPPAAKPRARARRAK